MEIAIAASSVNIATHKGAYAWRTSLVVIAMLISLPVMVIVASLLQPYSPAWEHLLDTVLADYVLIHCS